MAGVRAIQKEKTRRALIDAGRACKTYRCQQIIHLTH